MAKYPYDEEDDDDDENTGYDDENPFVYQNMDLGTEDDDDENPYDDSLDNNEDEDDSQDQDDEDDDENDEDEEASSKEDNESKAKAIEDKVKKGATKDAGKTAKGAVKAGGKISKGFAKAGSFIVKLFTPPILYVTLAVIAIALLLIIILVVIPAIAGAPYENIDVANGYFDTANGVKGDKFYGVRVIYEDNDRAIKDLEKHYENLMKNYLSNLDELDGLDLSFSLEYSNERPDEITALIKIIANVIDNSEEDLDLSASLPLINHFGYTDYELDTMCVNIKSYLTLNSSSYFVLDESYTNNLEEDLDWVFTTNYSKLNTISPLYYVKDVILTEDDMISGLAQKKYVAMFYMPKDEVEFNDVEYMFYIPTSEENNEDLSIKFEMIKVENGVETVVKEDEVTPSWWGEDQAEETSAIDNLNLTLSAYQSFDSSKEGYDNVSLYSLIYDETMFTLRTENISNIFKTNTITSEGSSNEYFEITYLPSLDNSYFYLKFDANCIFQFCEYDVSYS